MEYKEIIEKLKEIRIKLYIKLKNQNENIESELRTAEECKKQIAALDEVMAIINILNMRSNKPIIEEIVTDYQKECEQIGELINADHLTEFLKRNIPLNTFETYVVDAYPHNVNVFQIETDDEGVPIADIETVNHYYQRAIEQLPEYVNTIILPKSIKFESGRKHIEEWIKLAQKVLNENY